MWENTITTSVSTTPGTGYVTVDGGSWTTGIDYSVTTAPWVLNSDAVYTERFDGTNYIKVDKGSPDKARYVIFYAVNKKDPMIFCKTRRDLYKEVKKLMKREEVDIKSIRIFGLVGGYKKARKLLK